MERNELKHKVQFTLGDVYDDGHGNTKTIYMKSNYSANEIDNLIRKFCKETGCDINEWCDGYDDGYISNEEFEKLIKNNVINPNKWNYEEEYGILINDVDEFVYLLGICITHVAPDFRWEYEELDYSTILALNGIGYGLFY